MKKGVILLSLVVILNIFYVSASFNLGNLSSNIDPTYSPGDKLRGWMNISFENEPSSSVLSSNFQGSISLLDLLENNSVDYSCMPVDCQNSYTSSNGQAEKSFSLNNGEKIVSFVINGNIRSIDEINFNLSIENQPSCDNPLEMDILNDGQVDWKARNFTQDFSCGYGNGMGCFNSGESLTESLISDVTPYCEKINLTEGGKFMLGAWVKKGSTAWQSGTLAMSLWNSDNQEQASCNLPEPSESGGEVSCNVSYSNPGLREYYVCIKATRVINGYSTKMEDSSPCGFYSFPGTQSEYHDYYLFAKSAKFDRVGIVRFNQAEFARQTDGQDLVSYVQNNYISGKFQNNCSGGCSIPIKFKTNGAVSVVISNVVLRYSSGAGSQVTNQIFDAASQTARITSDFKILDLRYGNFSVPSSYGNSTFELSLGSSQILTKRISVERIPVINSISPRTVSAAINTKLYASVSSPANKTITKYKWIFGDNSSAETSNNSVEHKYGSVGTFTLKLEVVDELGFNASREFDVVVASPRNSVNSTIKDYRKKIDNITSQVEAEAPWIKRILNAEVNISEINEQLKEQERKLSLASTDQNYVDIMANLSELNIPEFFKKSNPVTLLYIPESSSIDLDTLKELGAGSYENEESTKEAIISWYITKVLVNSTFYNYVMYYADETRPLLSYHKISIRPIESSASEHYLVIGNINAVFNDENAKDIGDSKGIVLSELKSQEVEFVVVGELNPMDTKFYISPKFSKLDVEKTGICNHDGVCDGENGENWKNCGDCKPYGLAALIIGIVLLIAIIVYVILRQWYKKKYETYLFKNRNDLFNIVNFINNALSKGIKPEEVVKNLKQAGWHSEQISYAFKKVKGKKIGMPI